MQSAVTELKSAVDMGAGKTLVITDIGNHQLALLQALKNFTGRNMFKLTHH
jgi:hypothetical protein